MKVFGVDFKGAIEKIKSVLGISEETIRKEPIIDKNAMSKLYKISNRIHKSDLAYKYLKGRGLGAVSPHIKLGFCKKCYESETKQDHPAMLATFSDPDGNPINIHRTYLTQDGKKLQVASPKKFLPSNGIKLSGGAARLFNYKSGPLAIAEGIETAIAISIVHQIPVWAALSAGLLESFEPPKNITKLEIYSDNDTNYTGQKAAYSLANRISVNMDIPVEVFLPVMAGTDFLDELKKEF